MIYVKSIVAGLVVVFLIIVISPFIMLPLGQFLFGKQAEEEGHTIGWDPLAWLQTSTFPWLILFFAFVAGFY